MVVIGAGEWKKGSRTFFATFEEFAQLDKAYWREQLAIRPEPTKVEEWYKSNINYFNQYNIGEDTFKKINTPILLVAGEKDANAPLETILSAYRSLPKAQLCIIPNAPHPVFIANFPAVWESIKLFLEK